MTPVQRPSWADVKGKKKLLLVTARIAMITGEVLSRILPYVPTYDRARAHHEFLGCE